MSYKTKYTKIGRNTLCLCEGEIKEKSLSSFLRNAPNLLMPFLPCSEEMGSKKIKLYSGL